MRDYRILIVDDEESLRLTFEMFLKRAGYQQVTVASTLAQAVELISVSPFDLIISDIVLGADKGTDLLRHIRETGITCPVVMITGFPNLDSASEAVRYGAFDYLAKPVNKEKLLRIVSQALKYRELELEKQELIRKNETYRYYLEAIFSSVRDAIIAVDHQLNILKLNHAAQQWFRDFRVDAADQVDKIPGDMGAACLRDARQVIETGQVIREHLVECVKPDGSVKMVLLTAAPLETGDEALIGAVLVARDITREKADPAEHGRNSFHGFIGASESMQRIYRLIENVGKVDTTVLITGESGTGKELAAEALHAESGRHEMALIKVDCAALAEDLLESELFGHRKGAFTGADRDRPGRLLQADKGTLLLDEIGDITPRMQLRLLRFLQEMTFTPVGSDNPVKVDVRVIAATNVDLRDMVRRGQFREDLYYRINVVEINLPPLRERRQCLPLLINHFLMFFCEKHNRRIHSVSDRAMTILTAYSWPGNVREMRHVLERGTILCAGPNLLVEHLPEDMVAKWEARRDVESGDARAPNTRLMSQPPAPPPRSAEHERQTVVAALRQAAGNKSEAARILSIDRSTLYRKIKRLGITFDQ
ncbi:MAG: sigma 54-interacting transcriptional regulator [Desulfofustis sp.]|nr:sigma 54-interacting transcriptional regulator [Desulfofustis sp.]